MSKKALSIGGYIADLATGNTKVCAVDGGVRPSAMFRYLRHWEAAMLTAFAAALCLGVQSTAFAADNSTIYPAVITKEYVLTEPGQRAKLMPGELVRVRNHDGESVEMVTTSDVKGPLIPKTNIATAGSFKKVTKWTGDLSATCEMTDVIEHFRISPSGAATTDISGTEDTWERHLYQSGSVVWIRMNHRGRLDRMNGEDIFVIMPSGHMCAENCDDCPD